ncbi:MAG: twin-arginine translocase TatA/TatE family subunit [Leptospiraceae bacterium]|nr:twin-arginine translocase TatA/TatE family subunit [Leptospiraceae bacterium]
MIGSLGIWEISVILVIILILFGGRKIPQLAKDLGSGIREFKKSLTGNPEEISDQREYEAEEPPARKKQRSKSRKS